MAQPTIRPRRLVNDSIELGNPKKVNPKSKKTKKKGK